MTEWMLTDEEFADAQMDYIKKHQQEAGVTWYFPLAGELRDDCNRKSQAKKLVEIQEEQLRYDMSALAYMELIGSPLWQQLKKEVGL